MKTLATLLFLSCGLTSANVLAEACDVVTRSSSDAVKPVELRTCYSFSGMPDKAIAWSCSNESKDMLSTEKHRVAKCPENSVARCVAPLTQESLANPRSTSNDPDGERPEVPENARVTTWYYSTGDLAQARVDCTSGGGEWLDQ